MRAYVRLLLTLYHVHNRMETQRKKPGFSWKRQNRHSGVLRAILQPLKMSKRYTIYIFKLRKVWGFLPCAFFLARNDPNGKRKIFYLHFSIEE